MKKSNGKELEKLLKDGWKNTEIKYERFKVYAKGNLGALYDTERDNIILIYNRSKK